MRTLSLNGAWEIVERPLDDGPAAAADVLAAEACMIGAVPGDVNDSLVQAGRLPEPLTGMNHRGFRFVEDRSWWFRKRFVVDPAWQGARAMELCLNGLDVEADIWLNGVHLGHHRSAFYPFVAEVQNHVRLGEENTLLVRLTTGQEVAAEHPDFPLLDGVPTEEGRGYPDRGMKERVFLRKPAYVWGWDWGPHLATCGITGDVELRAKDDDEIVNVMLRTSLCDDRALVHVVMELEHGALVDSAYGAVQVTLTDEDGETFSAEARDVFIASGINYVELDIEIPEPRLWWPHGSGEPHLYEVQVGAEVDGKALTYPAFRQGLRTVDLDVGPGRFQFKINGEPLFIQGGNWIPCDALYGRITPQKVIALVEDAAEANFNCLRIWGGGRYELDAFYEACDRLGILVWQDFMSACAPLPGDLPWFQEAFRKEAEFQIRRLRNHACLLLWCGNNEVAGCYKWVAFMAQHPELVDPGQTLYHYLLPPIVRALCPHVPYWPTSPYGGQGTVNDPDHGDDHHWVVMRPEPECWSCPEYWDEPERPIFNSEYGYGGPCCLESTREYLGMEEPDLLGAVGKEHTNSFYDIQRVNFSIQEHYCDTADLPLEKYILYGGLCQGLNLGYSLESLRANERTMGGIFWMYDDTWGENGWTLIDYYLRHKISYYNVRRCLAPQRLVLRRGGQAFGGEDGEVLLLALNDRPQRLTGSVRAGFQRYDGTTEELQTFALNIPARSKALVASLPLPDAEALTQGTLVAVPDLGLGLVPVSWRQGRFRDLGVPPATVTVIDQTVQGNDLAVRLKADCFAHAVHLDIPGDYRLSDHFFDLLPREERCIVVWGGAGLGAVKARCVNDVDYCK